MLITLCALAPLALPAGVPHASQESAAQETPEPVQHGKLTWFQGSFEELLQEAEKSGKIMFLDFWADS
ncbi:MAG: hypothetical protein O7B99_04380 [Planctomycetota bacterium]|nr:hypothetical protein [Planctomycetota bacterium]